ncbi:rootletin [Euwallacea similis]|uniref:rootletin n=1 Tax=Euwallacea similis TaxID=1736056 RepID=UPI00344CD25F
MSPEINGNPPSVTKRKKNREKKTPAEVSHNFDLNVPSCNYFPANQYPYPNFTIPDMVNGYYPFMNCPNPSEPMSLPVYPMNYPSYPCPGSFMGSIGNLSRRSTLSNNPFMPAEVPDYMSLPVVTTDPEEESKRRFSDPGLPNDSDSSSTSYDETVQKLTRQIHMLTENNSRLSREVMELRLELNVMKQQQGSRHYEREYEPGMLADVIREVREAARVREDALLARMRHIMEEKQLSVSQLSLSMEKDRHSDRILKLEEQLKCLTVGGNTRSDDTSLNSSVLCLTDEKNKSARQVLDLEREALELRRELQDTRAKKEEADQKVLRLSSLLRRNEVSASEPSEDGKTSADSLSTITTSSLAPPPPTRVFLSGPVTSL